MLVETRDNGYHPNFNRSKPKVYSPSQPDASATLANLREQVKGLARILDDRVKSDGQTVLGLSSKIELLGAGCPQLLRNHHTSLSAKRVSAGRDITLVENAIRGDGFQYGSVYASSGNATLNIPNTHFKGFALDWALIRAKHERLAENATPHSDVFNGEPGTNVLYTEDEELEPESKVYKIARSGYAVGRVSRFRVDIHFDDSESYYKAWVVLEQASSKNFMFEGDSGCWCLNAGGFLVGLGFGGEETNAGFMSPIRDVYTHIEKVTTGKITEPLLMSRELSTATAAASLQEQ